MEWLDSGVWLLISSLIDLMMFQTPCSDAEPEDDLGSRPGTTTSTTFHPSANTYHLPPDIVLVSLDLVCFHVHTELLLIVSQNRLNSLLSSAVPSSEHTRTQRLQRTYVDVSEQSQILNIILHVAYGLSVDPYAPTFEMLSQAFNRLPTYGIEPKTAATSLSAFHSTLMTHAPTNPIELYILASKHDCFDLAVSVSPFLLSYRVENMTDTTAEKIGPVYLARLFSLQCKRLAALRETILSRGIP
ncbi:hypothetical protein PQX77_009094 [Marasmius sp. AFHP31]|nr:hypothetical protein PQX77_009094 [Marasmius sp. AFHP31]